MISLNLHLFRKFFGFVFLIYDWQRIWNNHYKSNFFCCKTPVLLIFVSGWLLLILCELSKNFILLDSQSFWSRIVYIFYGNILFVQFWTTKEKNSDELFKVARFDFYDVGERCDWTTLSLFCLVVLFSCFVLSCHVRRGNVQFLTPETTETVLRWYSIAFYNYHEIIIWN